MEVQKNISIAMKRKLTEYKNQEEFARELGVGRTTFQNCLAGRGNPNVKTIERLARGMGITPAQLVSGESRPTESAFDLISGLLDTLHPTLVEAGVIQLEAMRRLLLLSEELCAAGRTWQYQVSEPAPSQYALKAEGVSGTAYEAVSKQSRVFTDSRRVAEAAAEIFTRHSLSPIHLDDAIDDFLNSL